MIKIFGAVLIFSASTAAGILSASAYRTRYAQLEAFYLLLTHIKAQICGFLIPLDRIYADFKNSALERCGFLGVLKSEGGESAVRKCRARLLLCENEVNEIERFFVGLGHHDSKEEERYCAYYIGRFEELCGKAREQMPAKIRLCRAFGALGGIMLAVILL